MSNKKKTQIKNSAKNDEKTLLHKILEVISSIFAIIVILVCAFTLIFRMIFKVEVVKIFGYSGLIILTGSMEPNYHPGDIIFIKEQKDYVVNDVITFHRKDLNMVVTHRIIEKDGNSFKTKGDANNSADDKAISLTDIEGKVIARVGGVGNFILFLQSPMGIFAILIVLVSLEVFFAAKRKLVEE